MEYDVIRIGNITIDKKNVLLFEINGVSAENYSVAKLKKIYFKPNIKLKFENNGELYCKAADMLFIFAHNGRRMLMSTVLPIPSKPTQCRDRKWKTVYIRV